MIGKTRLSFVVACAAFLSVNSAAGLHLLAAQVELGPEGRAAVSALADAIDRRDLKNLRESVRKVRRLEAGAEAIPILLAGLNTDDEKLRRQIVESLGTIHPTTEAAISALVDLSAGDDDIRSHASNALSNVGAPAIPLLRKALKDERTRVRRGAAVTLCSMAVNNIGVPGKDAVADIAGALRDENAMVRSLAAGALECMGSDAEAAVPSLVEALRDEEQRVRLAAIDALGKIGPAAESAIPVLRRIVLDNAAGAWTAIDALGRIGTPAAPTPTELLSHKDADVRRFAAQEFARIGPDAKAAVPVLAKLLKDDDVDVRLEAAVALYAIDGRIDESTPVLVEGLKVSPRYVSGAVIRIGPPAKAVLPALIKLVRETDDEQVRVRAVMALGYIGPEAKDAVPLLLELAGPMEGVTWFPSIHALGLIGRPAVPALVETLTDPESPSREHAADALGEMGPVAKDAIPSLLQAFDDDDEEVRNAVRNAIRDIAFSEIGRTPPLATLLSMARRDERVRDIFAKKASAKGIDVDDGIEAAIVESYSAAIPWAVETLSGADGEWRKRAAVTLRMTGPHAKAASAALLSHLEDEDVFVRINSAAALWAINDDEQTALPILSHALEHPDDDVRLEAAMALKELGSMAKPALPALRKAFPDRVPSVSAQVAEAMANVAPDDEAGVLALMSLFVNDIDDRARGWAARALERLGPRAATAVPLLQRLRVVADEWEFNQTAARLLQKIQNAQDETVEALVE